MAVGLVDEEVRVQFGGLKGKGLPKLMVLVTMLLWPLPPTGVRNWQEAIRTLPLTKAVNPAGRTADIEKQRSVASSQPGLSITTERHLLQINSWRYLFNTVESTHKFKTQH